jgi:hypothetical protein
MAFDWLEHDREDLSGEAANTANNGATFYYVIWNQWQEDEHENVSESDAIFRRIMYLDDTAADPTATILYTSRTAAGYNEAVDLLFVGTAVDNDHMGQQGIVGYRWSSNLDGLLSTEKSFSRPVTDFSLGLHTITFSAQDDEGVWSTEQTVTLWVVEELHQVFAPLIAR